MTGSALARPRVSLPAELLDLLELVQTGALPSYPLGAEPGHLTVTLPPAPPQTPSTSVEVELTDLEGVPVARMTVAPHGDSLVASGVPTWLATRSSRPFEGWHVGPRSVADHTGLVVLRQPADRAEVVAALRRSGPRPLLLVLASLDGDATLEALDLARLACVAAGEVPGARVAVAPAPSLAPAEQEAVVRSYADGRPVQVPASLPVSAREDRRTVIFFTGLSGSGKSSVARAVRNRLVEAGQHVTLLDGDVVRRHLSAGLGFSPADRDTNVRRIGWVAAEIAHHGGIAICCPIAPFEQTRQEVRRMVQSRGGRFLLVHVATPLAECERRDRKGLYAQARRGELDSFTGISSPYEEPADPDLRVDTTGRPVDEVADEVLSLLGAVDPC